MDERRGILSFAQSIRSDIAHYRVHIYVMSDAAHMIPNADYVKLSIVNDASHSPSATEMKIAVTNKSTRLSSSLLQTTPFRNDHLASNGGRDELTRVSLLLQQRILALLAENCDKSSCVVFH